MALAQLIYVSQRKPALTMKVLEEIVARSAANNAGRGISGALLCCGHHLMQVLEGELADIAALFERIRLDERHGDVCHLISKNVAKRMFPEWSMTLADITAQTHIDRERLVRLIDEVRTARDTGHHSVEARLLINDFTQQMQAA